MTAAREEALRARPGPPLVPLALLLLRWGRSEKLALLLEGWKPLLAEVSVSAEGQEQLQAVVHYLLRVGVKEARQRLWQVLDSVVGEQRAEELMETMAEALIKQGHQKGRVEGRAEAVLQILSVRGLTVDEKARAAILSCRDLDTVDLWLKRAVGAASVAEVLR